MARCGPRRCAMYEHRGLMFSEPMEVAEMVMTGRHRRVPVVRGHLGGALYRPRKIFGAETIEVRDADVSAFGGLFGLREYPEPRSDERRVGHAGVRTCRSGGWPRH